MPVLLPPRTRPYPGDIEMAGTLLMLARPQGQPPIVRMRALDLVGSVSTEFLYSRASPLKERPQSYASLTRGMGLDEQLTTTDLRYSYAIGADLSCGVWQLGPDITSFTPGTTAGFANQFGFEIGGNLYPLAGRYILQRVSDSSWTVAKDLGSGKAALNATTFFSNVGGGVQRVFLGVSGDKAWHFDGTTWTQFATFTALGWVVVGRDLYRAHDVNQLGKCSTDSDPTNEANYTINTIVGDKGAPIVTIAKTIAEVLLIFKTDGVWTLASDGTPHHLFPNVSFEPGADNGKVVGYFGNDIYCTYGQTFYRITPDLTIDPIGPDRRVGSTAPVHGRMTAFCGVSGLFGHGAIYNNTDSYLMKFGGFEEDSSGALRRTDAWHGSLSQPFPSKKLLAMQVSTVGAPTNHTRTYAGFDDGSAAWWTNPCSPNPIACDQYRWTTTTGEVILPRWHGANIEDAKALHSVSMLGPKLDTTNYAQFTYRLDPSATNIGTRDWDLWSLSDWDYLSTLEWDAIDSQLWTDLGFTFNKQREKFPFSTSTVTSIAQFRVLLKASANNATPQVSGVSVWHAWRPDRLMDVNLTVIADDGQLMRNGTPLRLTGNRIKAMCEGAIDNPGGVRVVLPDGTTESIAFLDMTEGIDWDTDYGTPNSVITMKGVTWASLATYGAWDRLTFGTWDDLSLLNWEELEAF